MLLPVVQVLDGDPPQLALVDLGSPIGIGRHREHPAFDPDVTSAAAADRADDDRAAAVDVAVQEGVQRHHRIVVVGGR